MARVCCVVGCDSLTKGDITFFPFPVKQSLRRKWREAVDVGKLTTDSLICSQHFNVEDYETVRGKTRLKAKVVPMQCTGTRRKASSKSPQPSENSSEAANGKADTHTPSSLDSLDANNSVDKPNETLSNGLADQETDELGTGKVTDQEDGKCQTINQESGKINQESGKDDTRIQETRKDADGNEGRDNKSEINEEKDQGNSKEDERGKDSEEKGQDNVMDIDGYLEQEVDFGVDDRGSTYEGSVDENGHEKCTIECVPEAVLAQDSDSNSESELHKGDIEDIIANYHIKRDKKLAERLKAAQEHQESRNQEGSKEGASRREGSNAPPDKGDSADDCVEVEFIPSKRARKEPVFIEISVDHDPNNWQKDSTDNDCMMVLEDVQVDIDPATVVPPSPERGGDVDSGSGDDVEVVPVRKEDPISLLTSSDEDEVIIEEPKIDTVEVSDEDEDDVPLVKLVQPIRRADDIGKILWGRSYEYYCFQCSFRTLKKGELARHRKEHATIMLVCEVCNFATPSKDQFARHKKKHRDEKKFKCHLCDYKAKHRMSLIYHLKSHEGVVAESLEVETGAEVLKKKLSCSKCKYTTDTKLLMMRHVRACALKKPRMFSCDSCVYQTKRASDLRRHRARKHSESRGDEEFVP